MIATLNKQEYLVKKRYPFLENFPFGEFTIEMGDPTFVPPTDEESDGQLIDSQLIKFTYSAGQSNIAVVIFDKELTWIHDIAEKIEDLDEITKQINAGLETMDLLPKRDATLFADEWLSKLQDGHTRLSYSTSGEILASLVRNHQQMVVIINKLVKLATGKGLLSLSNEEYAIVLTYYHFQLVYAKLMLGLVISAKISF